MNTKIIGKDLNCPFCKRELVVVIDHFLDEDKDKLELVRIEGVRG